MKKLAFLSLAALTFAACGDMPMTPTAADLQSGTPLKDEVSNTISGDVDAAAESMSLTAGGANGSTKLFVQPTINDGKQGCNLQGGEWITVAVASSNTSVATVTSEVTITGCGPENGQTVIVTPVAEGSTTITASLKAKNVSAGTFTFAAATFTVNVAQAPIAGKQSQTIAFAQPASPATYGSTFNVTPRSSSGLAVRVDASGGCTAAAAVAPATGYDVTMTSGTMACVLTASQGGDATYNPAENVARTVNAQPRAITATADAKSKIYGETDPAFTYQITGSLVGSDDFTGALSRVAGENVGTYAIEQGTLALSSDYALSFLGADLTITKRAITATADAKSKVYGDADPALTYQVTSGSLVGSDDFTGALSRVAGENVGTYPIEQGSLTAGSNYTLTFVGTNLTIEVRPIQVTADAKSKVYGDADPALTYQVTSGSLVGSDDFTGALSRVAGENVGTYAIQKGALSLGSNYDIEYVGAGLTIRYGAISYKFLPPLNNTAAPWNEAMSAFKYGSTIPVKFQLFNAAGQPVQLSNGALPTVTLRKISSAQGIATVSETVVSTTADSGTNFRWDATAQQYIFNLSTKTWESGFRYEITARLDGGQTIVTEVTTKR